MCAQQPDLVLSGGYDHKVAVWDVRDPEKPSMAMEHGAPVEAVLVLPGGGLVASVGGEVNSTIIIVNYLPKSIMMIVLVIATVKLEVEQNVSGCGGCIIIASTSIRFRHNSEITCYFLDD